MKITVEKIMADYTKARKFFSPIFKEMAKDIEFSLGKQWKEEDVRKLELAGVKALTINKIRPIIKLISGIERQSKSDYVVFPEGDEDGLKAEVSTSLLKNIVKQSRAERKLSECFKRGVVSGADFIEPYIDYTYDILNGEIKLRSVEADKILFDPDASEYDLCDAKYVIKMTCGVSKDDLIDLFPNKKALIESLSVKKISDNNSYDSTPDVQSRGYGKDISGAEDGVENLDGYDLLDYHYKCPVDKFFVVDPVLQVVQEFDSKETADEYISIHPEAKYFKKRVPEIRTAFVVGDTIVDDVVAWTFPKWRKFPIIPFFAEWWTGPLKDRSLKIQGVVRGIKDLQEEYNKRRTQELRHLNSSVNSGMLSPKGALDADEKAKVKEFGSSPGVFIEYDPSIGKPEKVYPTPLSTAHAQLAMENAQDLKESSGVNPDLLANADSSQSGRAILLKQKQGLVMVQEVLDNYSETKKLLGMFLLTQIGEVYTVETARRVLGEAFFKNNIEFMKPVIGQDGIPVVGQEGKVETEIDEQMIVSLINQILNESSDLSKYDLSIGEGAYSETVKISNYLTLSDMAKNGLPIPPDVLINESMLPASSKAKILAAIETARNNANPQGGIQ